MDSLSSSTLSSKSNELNKLALAGLPTSFGPSLSLNSKAKTLKKKQNKQKKKRNKNKELFRRYFNGIKLDEESKILVTPEKVAEHIARRCTFHSDTAFLLDPFCGVGGNVIQFALARPDLFILAIDISAERIEMCRNNAKVYGVDHRIEFVQGDYMQLGTRCNFKPDVVFLSPPWGGKSYKDSTCFQLNQMPIDGTKIFENTKKLTNNICYYLPRNVDEEQLLLETEPYFELEEERIDYWFVAVTAYYGNLIMDSYKDSLLSVQKDLCVTNS